MRTKDEIKHVIKAAKEVIALLRQSAEKAGEDLSDYYLAETAGRLETMWALVAQQRALQWVLEKAGSEAHRNPRAGVMLNKLLENLEE